MPCVHLFSRSSYPLSNTLSTFSWAFPLAICLHFLLPPLHWTIILHKIFHYQYSSVLPTTRMYTAPLCNQTFCIPLPCTELPANNKYPSSNFLLASISITSLLLPTIDSIFTKPTSKSPPSSEFCILNPEILSTPCPLMSCQGLGPIHLAQSSFLSLRIFLVVACPAYINHRYRRWA